MHAAHETSVVQGEQEIATKPRLRGAGGIALSARVCSAQWNAA